MTSRDIEGDYEQIREDLAKLRADLASLGVTLKDATSGTVTDQIAQIRARIDDLTDEAQQRGRAKLDELTDQIEQKPLTSMLVAFGAGLLIGRLLDR